MLDQILYIRVIFQYMMSKHLYIMVYLHYMLTQTHYIMYLFHYIMCHCLYIMLNIHYVNYATYNQIRAGHNDDGESNVFIPYHQTALVFHRKKNDIFKNLAQNIDCGFTLKTNSRGGSNEFPL